MDFFEAQDQARRATRRLVIFFILAVIGIVLAINAVMVVVVHFVEESQREHMVAAQPFEWWRPGLFAVVSAATVVLILGASGFKTMQIHGDGGKVARMLGGRLLDPQTTDADERKLLNVVEEMSIASGVPVPDVYVMDREAGINAFAAGSSIDAAAIGVTRGCMQLLTRDELQGVVAHEFSHVINGDMRLNIRLIGVIFGILVIGLIGYMIFRYAPFMLRSGRSSGRNQGGAAGIVIALFVAGALIWLIGSIGVFFGRLIQASISRQREFLADAAAVQFTRNNAGIRDALRKIGGAGRTGSGGRVDNHHAGEISHMFFVSGFSAMFSTHPPLPDRIKAVDPAWDGSMLKPEPARPVREETRRRGGAEAQPGRAGRGPLDIPVFGDVLRPHTSPHAGHASGGMLDLAILAGAAGGRQQLQADHLTQRVGQLSENHVAFAHQLIERIPPKLRDAAHDPVGARGVVAAAFFHHGDEGIITLQQEVLAQQDEEAARVAERFTPVLGKLGPAYRLPVVEICLPALRRLDRGQARALQDALRKVIEADQKIAPFEYALFKIVERQLGGRRPHRSRWASVNAVRPQVQTVLSALAAAGHTDPAAAQAAFVQGARRLQLADIAYQPNFRLPDLDRSLEELADASPAVKRRVIDAAGAVVAADGAVRIEEAEMLRAVATVLEIPLPPFLQPAAKAKSSKPKPAQA